MPLHRPLLAYVDNMMFEDPDIDCRISMIMDLVGYSCCEGCPCYRIGRLLAALTSKNLHYFDNHFDRMLQ